jgi:hypothetical protein
MQQNLYNWSNSSTKREMARERCQDEQNLERHTKSNTAAVAPLEPSTEPRTRAWEHKELRSLARNNMRDQTWMREQACSMASMVAWSCCGSGLPPGKPCMAAGGGWRLPVAPGAWVSAIARVQQPASGHATGRGWVGERTEAAVETEGGMDG